MMKRIILSLIAALAGSSLGSQNHQNYYKNGAGETISETLRMLDTSNHPVVIRVPSDTCLLFYRVRGKTWIMDNRDSVEQVENIIGDLQRSSEHYKYLKIVCYAYNTDNFIKTFRRSFFQSSLTYKADYYSLPDRSSSRLTGGDKLILVSAKGRVLASSPYIASFSYRHKAEDKKIRAKLLTEKNGRQLPLVNTNIYLFSRARKDTISFAQTDRYGDFELTVPESGTDHTLKVEPADRTVKNIILADQDGVEQARLKRAVTLFEYKLIEADVIRLSEMPETDITFALRDFVNSGEREFVRSERIRYEIGSYQIPEESKKILDRMAEILTDHPKLNLQVISHTDAQGDDKMNLELSQKRSMSVVSYLILIGIDRNRLSYAGKGEAEIRNRCKNGVDCSPREHAFNRRTEFRFVKN